MNGPRPVPMPQQTSLTETGGDAPASGLMIILATYEALTFMSGDSMLALSE